MTINIDKTGAGPVLDIDHLKVTFATDAGDVYAVKDVSLKVSPGEVVAIVGESGSGKTVTANTILGLLPETAISSGAVLINGNNVISVSPAKLRQIRGRDVAMVFQEPSTALNPVFTVGWQIAEGIRAHAGHGGGARVSAKEAKARAIEALRKVGIPDPETRVNYYPHQFSGGQKQRVVIAAALALNPGLIVADEPTTALDVTVQAEILELLRDLRDQYGTSIVLITHNMGVVADLADRIAYANLRRIVAENFNMRVDKMSMAMSIETRAPFEDYQMVELAFSLPLTYKLRNGDFKRVLKDAVRDLVPESILTRPKWGFNPPQSGWLRTALRPLVERVLTPERIAAVGIFRPEAVQRAIHAHIVEGRYEMWAVWSLLVFHLWHALYIEQSWELGDKITAADVAANLRV